MIRTMHGILKKNEKVLDYESRRNSQQHYVHCIQGQLDHILVQCIGMNSCTALALLVLYLLLQPIQKKGKHCAATFFVNTKHLGYIILCLIMVGQSTIFWQMTQTIFMSKIIEASIFSMHEKRRKIVISTVGQECKVQKN